MGVLVARSCLTPGNPMQPSRLLCPWDSPGKNTEVGCHFLLQEIFLTQGSNPGSPALQADSSLSEPPVKQLGIIHFFQSCHFWIYKTGYIFGDVLWRHRPRGKRKGFGAVKKRLRTLLYFTCWIIRLWLSDPQVPHPENGEKHNSLRVVYEMLHIKQLAPCLVHESYAKKEAVLCFNIPTNPPRSPNHIAISLSPSISSFSF